MLRTDDRSTALLKSSTRRSGFFSRNGRAELGPSMMTSRVPCPRCTRTFRMVVGARLLTAAMGPTGGCGVRSAEVAATTTGADCCVPASFTAGAAFCGTGCGEIEVSAGAGLAAGAALSAGAGAGELASVETAAEESAVAGPPPLNRTCRPPLTSFTSAVTCSPSSN